MSNVRMSHLGRLLCATAALLLFGALFVPLWRIELDAPQYPEGLALLIYPHKIAGDVDIINGLNHYIGMQTLHAENFVEFTLLPYLIVVFALFALLTAFLANRGVLRVLLISFALFGVVAMIDFWRWEYNYGHNLDPNAAIKVPGMSYQPPLIGFKQLLNFGAYSIPDIGGWFFIGAGLLILSALIWETRAMRQRRLGARVSLALLTASLMTGTSSCSSDGPEPIVLNKDKCAYCRMNISDPKFAAELITQKGRVYKFDDLSCMLDYLAENRDAPPHGLWVSDYQHEKLIPAETACYLYATELKSPMAGNVAAFADSLRALPIRNQYNTKLLGWPEVKANTFQ